ncbi:hypothetical protein FANTH_14778 [Fusarium anthophilum]|uniref:NAD(P)-binding domain-containing protein n=1 Tax=Fusarium anthophilum TaxID=48485 RepID=A0A8H5DL51_9HYPO|nr:hypothetical protein FANTH_14778 [Fusarium anthophilum]
MVTIAVAGGTGNVGRTLVEALKESPKHDVIVLARKAPDIEDSAAPVIVVSYSDIDNLVKILEDHNVHTVVSAMMVLSPDASNAQVNLIQAAAKSASTQRFVTSEWGARYPLSNPGSQPEFRELAVNELRQTDLEWTRFRNGYFLDYYGMPHVKSHMTPLDFVVDMANKTAAIPGTGDEPMTFTYTYDLAKFFVAALDLQKWDEETFCYSDKTTWNEFLKLAEESRGEKFSIVYDDIQKLRKGEITELPSHPAVYPFFPKPALQGLLAKLETYVVEGYFDIPVVNSLNQKFPEISTMKVKDMVGLWKGI